ncbi:Do family serine endopeptidase [Halosquirtibacter xylanolyticus]|uniref:Do family serine endopeptidase n=1 Tax=Halosquirtibacter xylanolyticus TaxID=3374599 RepID=UPI00374804BC|nr:Do family serine endopeptidase [Prolixibacteraceae bacterium]
MKNLKSLIKYLSVAFTTSLLTILGVFTIISNKQVAHTDYTYKQPVPTQLSSFSSSTAQQYPNLTNAAEKSVHAVVHITTQKEMTHQPQSLFDLFYGNGSGSYNQPQVQQASGSGVIISSDGYIVTNNHVIDDADNIKVIFEENKTFDAKLVGTDPNTDIAILKVEAEGLPYLEWGDAQKLKLGEWVLAVGNPFSLNSTVTAGIVSAKSRSIGIMSGQMALESFIQTDAAVNPGNSGGALVNQSGQLVGINTAIASRTGSYSGYSFAVPSTIAKKVVGDILKYGAVQRAILGVQIRDNNSQLAEEEDLDITYGAYVARVTDGSGAEKAGIESGDIIIAVNERAIKNTTQLREQVGQYSPGNTVTVKINRDGDEKEFTVELQNLKGNTNIIKATNDFLGAKFKPLNINQQRKFSIQYGLQVTSLSDGKLKNAGIKKGFIITSVNNYAVSSVKELQDLVMNTPTNKQVLIEGVYPNGEWAYHIFKNN